MQVKQINTLWLVVIHDAQREACGLHNRTLGSLNGAAALNNSNRGVQQQAETWLQCIINTLSTPVWASNWHMHVTHMCHASSAASHNASRR
jgi:hypothetical protein